MRNKRGTTTLFLAIILSALILVETTYMALVADLDRRLTYTRALKEQTEVYLASYDRQLFKAYGIYAFNSDMLDSAVFDQILASNGYETGDVIYTSGMYYIDTEVLRRSVASYYAYRTSGIVFQRFASLILSLMDQLGNGIIGELRQFTSSPASGILGRIIDGGAEISEAIASAVEALGFDDSSPEVQLFLEIISTIGSFTNDSPDIGNSFDPSDLGFVYDILEFNASLYDIGTDFNETVNMHGCLADYAGNNFDCLMSDDTTLNGTPFSSFHEGNSCDCEYILTGLEEVPACALTDFYIFGCLYLRSLVINITDPSRAEIISAASEILSAVITVVSAGSVPLPPSVYQAVIILLIAEIDAIRDLITVLNGGEITFISIGEIDAVTLDYRSFLTVFMNYVPDGLLLERMLNVLNRDFPGYLTGIDTETDYRSTTITYEGRYEYYE